MRRPALSTAIGQYQIRSFKLASVLWGPPEIFFGGGEEGSGKSTVKQDKALPNSGPHHTTNSCHFAKCCTSESYLIIELQEGRGLQSK